MPSRPEIIGKELRVIEYDGEALLVLDVSGGFQGLSGATFYLLRARPDDNGQAASLIIEKLK